MKDYYWVPWFSAHWLIIWSMINLVVDCLSAHNHLIFIKLRWYCKDMRAGQIITILQLCHIALTEHYFAAHITCVRNICDMVGEPNSSSKNGIIVEIFFHNNKELMLTLSGVWRCFITLQSDIFELQRLVKCLLIYHIHVIARLHGLQARMYTFSWHNETVFKPVWSM